PERAGGGRGRRPGGRAARDRRVGCRRVDRPGGGRRGRVDVAVGVRGADRERVRAVGETGQHGGRPARQVRGGVDAALEARAGLVGGEVDRGARAGDGRRGRDRRLGGGRVRGGARGAPGAA